MTSPIDELGRTLMTTVTVEEAQNHLKDLIDGINPGEKLLTAARRPTKDFQRRAADQLSELTESTAPYGKDIMQEVQNRLILDSFTKDATRGSKGVNLGAFGGVGVGQVLSMMGLQVPGAVITAGSILGALRDA